MSKAHFKTNLRNPNITGFPCSIVEYYWSPFSSIVGLRKSFVFKVPLKAITISSNMARIPPKWADSPSSPSTKPIPSITYPIPSQEYSNVLVAPLGLRVSMGGDDHLLSVYVRLNKLTSSFVAQP
ncbi:hypothetical protein EVAR_29762_1 [Eumeta japonica]|uniref:Uncharacterized protein n=1 Tax=Eumeta variegata TaxID=151549 RepID=A0A4C1WVL1_EUMVA|nr:hypothetical protein EVAR_29762_1 [Eumeta japonica]